MMTMLWATIAGGLWKPILAGLTVILGFLGLYVKGRKDGAAKLQVQQAKLENRALRTRNEVDRDLNADPSMADDVLRRYARDGDVLRGVGADKPEP